MEEEDYIDPATAVVNNIASKQIARKRQRREQQRARENAPEETPPETPQQLPPEKQPRPAPKAGKKPCSRTAEDEVKQVPGKGAAFMERIDGDINAPLSGTAEYVKDETPPVPEPLPRVPLQRSPSGWKGRTSGKSCPAKCRNLSPTRPSPRAQAGRRQDKAHSEAKSGKVTTKEAAQSARQVAAEIAQTQGCSSRITASPPLDLLKRPVRAGTDGTEEMRENSRRLNETPSPASISTPISSTLPEAPASPATRWSWTRASG